MTEQEPTESNLNAKQYDVGTSTALVRQIITVQRRYRQNGAVLFEPIAMHEENFCAQLTADDPAESHQEMLDTLKKATNEWNLISGFDTGPDLEVSDEHSAWTEDVSDQEEPKETEGSEEKNG